MTPHDAIVNDRPRRGGKVGITRKVQVGIARATSIIANGRSWERAAAEIGATLVKLKDWQYRYPAIWQSCYDQAMQVVVETVRTSAGTNAILADVPTYMATAIRAERWTRERGEDLFSGQGMTLARFYHEVYKPMRLGEARKSTLYLHEIVLRKWRLLTGDPPISEITSLLLSRFRDCMAAMLGKNKVSKASPTTVHTELAIVQTLLDKAGPAGPRNRDAAGILDKVPWIRPPKRRFRQVRLVKPEELEAVFLATAGMDEPLNDGIKPPAWWKALLVVTYFTGLRRGTLFALEMKEVDLERSRIYVPAEKMKTRMPLHAHLPAVAVEHLRGIRTDRSKVFPWPNDSTWFYNRFHRLQDAAGLARKDHFGLHDLRKTLATMLWEQSPAAAQLALGHTSNETTMQYYVQAAGIVARAIDQLPIPKMFMGERGDTDAA